MIAALGPEGTFSHELALSLFGEGEVQLLPTIRRIFDEVEKGGCDGVVPLENSEVGGVGPTLDCLQTHQVFITGEAYMEVHHHLAGFGKLEDLTMIYVHPQTHEQCSEFLEKLGLEVIHTSSNAASAQAMKERKHAGAIVSELAARIYRIPIIRRDVQNTTGNTTRFILISSRPPAEARPAKCSILIDPREDRPGLLHDLLSVFARRGINLTRIESRPSKRGMGSYIFFLDFATSRGWEVAIRELHGLTHVKNLGCYRRVEVPGWR
ncbi:MAG TPA: prephenate dehydratase domain-containing protein [Methanomicrobiales archaeon]|nr:prephenate dehydratase domain-containing protein [Methanomicrobiales archaeon]